VAIPKVRPMPETHEDQAFAPATPPPAQSSAEVGLLAMALIWGLNFPLIKASLAELPPLAFNALRFPLAALTVLLVLRAKGHIPWPERADLPRIVGLGILGNVVYQGFFIFGLNATYAGNASILLATTPVWTLAFSTLRGHERPGSLMWLGISATLLGMVLVVAGGGLVMGLEGATLRGDLLLVGAAVTWSLYSVGSRRMIHKYGSVPTTAWTLWTGSVGLVLWGLPSLLATPIHDISSLAWVGVAYAGILAIGLAYLLWYRAVLRIGNSRTAAYSNLTPVVALAVAWVWLGETPAPMQLMGAAVILSGLYLTRLGGARPAGSGGTRVGGT
jgi:drug/metabolite transporter (DMT)-like permease